MKPSHFVTPRTLDQCVFIGGGESLERYDRPIHDRPIHDRHVGVALAIVFFIALGLLWMTR